MKKISLCAGLLVLGALCGCRQAESTGSIPAVKEFDASRYGGRWYEVARLPHAFERGVYDVEAVYTMRPDGKLTVLNTGVECGGKTSIEGVAAVLYHNIGEMKVSFGWPMQGLYKVIWLDREYQLAIVTGDTKAYAWVLAREKRIPQEKLNEVLKMLETWGYEVKLLQYPNGQILP